MQERNDYLTKHKKLNDTIPTLELKDKEIEENKDEKVDLSIVQKTKIPSNNPREYDYQIC